MTGTPTRIAGVVPAAGASSRMGTPKALLDADGRPFIVAVVEALVTGGCDPVVVVVGSDHPEAATSARSAGALVVENPDPGEGPITSVRRALQLIPGDVDAFALLPVDHPTVLSGTVAALVQAFRSNDAPLVIPVFGGRRGHPVLLGRALFPALTDPALQGGARTVVHANLGAAVLVDVDDPGVVADVDTPEAYRARFGAGGGA